MRISILGRILSLAGFIIAAAWAASADNAGPGSQAPLLSPKLQATNADAAWTELGNANHPPPGPAQWRDTPPTFEEKQKFYRPYVLAFADKAKDFYIKFPKDKRASEAKLMEFQVISKWDATNQPQRIEAIGRSLLSDPTVTAENHFAILWNLAQDSAPAQARPMFQEIINSSNAPPQMKEGAAEALNILIGHELMGKPVNLQFTAVDGRSVDLARLRGKVVLLDFWATWCPPCVMEMPDVKTNYVQFHAKGFEIVGIDMDDFQDKLTQYVADNKIEWPQYFDGLHWKNKIAVRFGIMQTPTMWLIDKKGNLRDLNAWGHLNEGVQKLLAE